VISARGALFVKGLEEDSLVTRGVSLEYNVLLEVIWHHPLVNLSLRSPHHGCKMVNAFLRTVSLLFAGARALHVPNRRHERLRCLHEGGHRHPGVNVL